MPQPATPRTTDRVLFPGKVVRVAAGPGGVLRAREGVLWVTYEERQALQRSDVRDHFVPAGGCLHLAGGDVVVVGASDARYGIASFDWEPQRLPAVQAHAAWRALLALLVGRRPAGGWLTA